MAYGKAEWIEEQGRITVLGDNNGDIRIDFVTRKPAEMRHITSLRANRTLHDVAAPVGVDFVFSHL